MLLFWSNPFCCISGVFGWTAFAARTFNGLQQRSNDQRRRRFDGWTTGWQKIDSKQRDVCGSRDLDLYVDGMDSNRLGCYPCCWQFVKLDRNSTSLRVSSESVSSAQTAVSHGFVANISFNIHTHQNQVRVFNLNNISTLFVIFNFEHLMFSNVKTRLTIRYIKWNIIQKHKKKYK